MTRLISGMGKFSLKRLWKLLWLSISVFVIIVGFWRFMISIPGTNRVDEIKRTPQIYREDKENFENNREYYTTIPVLSGFDWNSIGSDPIEVDLSYIKEYLPEPDNEQFFYKLDYLLPVDEILYNDDSIITGFIVSLKDDKSNLLLHLFHLDSAKEFPNEMEILKRLFYTPLLEDSSGYVFTNSSVSLHSIDDKKKCVQFINQSKFRWWVPGHTIENNCIVVMYSPYSEWSNAFRENSPWAKTYLSLSSWISWELEHNNLRISIEKMK